MGCWRDPQWLRVLAILPEDLSLIPSTCVGQLTTTCKSSSKGSDTSGVHDWEHVHTHRDTWNMRAHMHIHGCMGTYTSTCTRTDTNRLPSHLHDPSSAEKFSALLTTVCPWCSSRWKSCCAWSSGLWSKSQGLSLYCTGLISRLSGSSEYSVKTLCLDHSSKEAYNFLKLKKVSYYSKSLQDLVWIHFHFIKSIPLHLKLTQL